jgi:spore coat protein A
MSLINRRDLLRSAGMLGTLGAISIAAGPQSRRTLLSLGSGAGGFGRPLPIPEVITDAEVTLVAQQVKVQILDGAPTTMWTYNGTFPGPTIRRPAGQPTRVTLQHDLPPAPDGVHDDNTLTLHHHGAHSASQHDGSPLPGNVIQPGESRTYLYEHTEDGSPERAATQWYHDHTHHRTSFNAWMGLGGLFILDDEYEQSLALPRGRYEIPLFLSDRTFDADNQLDVRIFQSTGAREVGGQTYLVNGAAQPFLEVEPRRYRLRAHHGGGFALYNLKLAKTASSTPADALLADAIPMTQIGTESGLLPTSVERTEVLLGPAERADLIVDFSDLAGQTLVLANASPRDTTRSIAGLPSTNPPAAAGDAVVPAVWMQIRVGTSVTEPDPGPPPASPRPLPDWAADVPQDPTRVFVFGQGIDPSNPTTLPHTINGRPFDHARVDAEPELDSIESWLLLNASPQTHYIHLHDVDWLVVSRNGSAPATHEAGLKETFKIDPGEVVVVGTKFTDHLGAYMIHCHMLDHEDAGMMARFDVVAPGAGTPTTLTADEQIRTDRLLGAIRDNPGSPAPLGLVQSLKANVVVDTAGSPYFCTFA